MKGTRLILWGGIANLLSTVSHALFWRFFDWPHDLASISHQNQNIMQVLNIHLILVFVLFTYVSLFRAQELLTTTIGRVVGMAIGLFWVLRAINEVIFWNILEIQSQVLIVVCILIGALYLVPLYQLRDGRAAAH